MKLLNKLTAILIIMSVTAFMLTGNSHASDFLWVANSGSNDVSKINAQTGIAEKLIPVGNFPVAAAVSRKYVFVANQNDKSVSAINKDSDLVEFTIPVDRHPHALAVGKNNSLYVIVTDNTIHATPDNMAYLYEIDIESRSKIREIKLHTITSLHIGIGISHENIAYIPYGYSWICQTGCLIVDLNKFELKGNYTHDPFIYGYLGGGITVDSRGYAWI